MRWLKHLIVDFLAVALIVYASFSSVSWAYWLALGYTGLMVALKVLSLALGHLNRLTTPKDDAPPTWAIHVLYGACVAVPLVGGLWVLGAGWAVIWGLSIWAEQRRLRIA
ncbi:MAG: hypothetical protein AAGI71_07660 [Bacteroidota bacterium]